MTQPATLCEKTTTPWVGAHILTRRCLECGAKNCVIFGRCQQCAAPLGSAVMERIDGAEDHSLPVGKNAHAVLARVSGADGARDFFPLEARETIVGRESGGPFLLDPYVTPQHCRITLAQDGIVVEDLSGVCGVFVQVCPDGSALRAQDMIRLGEQLLRVDIPEGRAEEAHLTAVAGSTPEDTTFAFGDRARLALGRSFGDVTFPGDCFLSAEHAEIIKEESGYYLFDLNSVNGTFIRVRGPRHVPFGGRLFIGQLLFAVLAPADAD